MSPPTVIITAANSLGNYCVTDAELDFPLAHTEPDAPVSDTVGGAHLDHTERDAPLAHSERDFPLASFSSAPNSPLKVDPDPRQAYFIFLFTITHLFICLGSYYCRH